VTEPEHDAAEREREPPSQPLPAARRGARPTRPERSSPLPESARTPADSAAASLARAPGVEARVSGLQRSFGNRYTGAVLDRVRAQRAAGAARALGPAKDLAEARAGADPDGGPGSGRRSAARPESRVDGSTAATAMPAARGGREAAAEVRGDAATAPAPTAGGEGAPPAAVPTAGEVEAGRPGLAQRLLEGGAEAFRRATWRVGRLRKNEREHEDAGQKLGHVKQAVLPPEGEAQSRANAEQVRSVGERGTPKTDVESVQRERDAALEDAAPETLEEVIDFRHDGGGQAVRASVAAAVRSQVKGVEDAYGDVGAAPAAPPAPTTTPPIPAPEAAPRTPRLLLSRKLVPEVPDADVDFRHHDREIEVQAAREGLDPQAWQEVDSGPLAEARLARGELQQTVREAPAELRREEAAEQGKLAQELDADERSERGGMTRARADGLEAVRSRQDGAKSSEEKKRKAVTGQIQRIYRAAVELVEGKLSTLEKDSLDAFDRTQRDATDAFEERVEREMEAFKDERYSGLRGKGRWLWDKLAGIEDHPRVLKIFSDAKAAYVAALDASIDTILKDTKAVIDECKREIGAAKLKIDEFVRGLGPDLRRIADGARKEFVEKLERLDRKVDARAKKLRDKLTERRRRAIQAIDEKIAAMKERLKGLAGKIASLIAKGALKLFRWALEKVGAPVEEILGALKRAGSSFMRIIRHPIDFLGNLIASVVGGFRGFSKRFSQHLELGFMGWIFGALGKAGVDAPREFSAKAIFGLALQVMDLTASAVERRLAKYVGEENVERVKAAWGVVSRLLRDGVVGLWESLKGYVGDLKTLVFGGLKGWLVTKVVEAAVFWLASLFNPVSAVVKAVIPIYKVVRFIIERIRQILDVMVAILESLADIAAGKVAKASAWVERALSRLVPLLIGFLASLLGLGGISAKVRGFLRGLRRRIERALDKLFARVSAQVAKLFGRKRGKDRDAGSDPERQVAAAPADVQKRWTRGQAAIDTLKQRAARSPLDERSLSRELAALKARYGFQTLDYELDGEEWVIRSRMNPTDRDRAKAKPIGTRQDPIDLTWPKRASSRYPTIYLGGKIGRQRSQSYLKSRVGKRDATGAVVRKYTPHAQDQEVPGERQRLGIAPRFQVRRNTVVGPLAGSSTPGGGKLNRLLVRHGFQPSVEGMDGDHVQEIQMGGVDRIDNLWPLDASENRGAGSTLAQTEVDVGGRREKLSTLKQRSRKYYFRVKRFKY